MEPQSFCAGRAGWRRELVVAPVLYVWARFAVSIILFCFTVTAVGVDTEWNIQAFRRALGRATRAWGSTFVYGPARQYAFLAISTVFHSCSAADGCSSAANSGWGDWHTRRQRVGGAQAVNPLTFLLARRSTPVASSPPPRAYQEGLPGSFPAQPFVKSHIGNLSHLGTRSHIL